MPRKRDHERDTTGLAAHAQRRSAEARQRVTQAIDRLVAERRPITFRAVAEAAAVTTQYLYSQPDLRERVEELRQREGNLRLLSGASPQRTRTDKSKDVLLAAKDKRIRELETEVERLRRELKTALGKLYEEL